MSISTPLNDVDSGADHSTPEPVVSVLMPCFNCESTIDEAVESIVAQHLEDLELIAVDDGSTDKTLERLRIWKGVDPRVRVVESEHAGIIDALNKGLSHCAGTFIARMDADDLSDPRRLGMQVTYLQENPGIGVVGALVDGFPAAQVREGFQRYMDWLNTLISPEDIAREIYIESPLAHPSVLIRKNLLLTVGGYQEHGWPEDYDLWLRLHLERVKFAKVPEVLLHWRENGQRLTRTDSRYSVENFLRAKANYLAKGPLQGRDAVIVWGAGQMGRRLSKHLLREGVKIEAFLDVDPKKIGRRMRDRLIHPVEELPRLWEWMDRPGLLACVGSRKVREQIRSHLQVLGMKEAIDWWAVA